MVPSYSVRVTRRPRCSQVTSRPCRSRVLPFEKFRVGAKDRHLQRLLVEAQHSVIGHIAKQETLLVSEIDGAFGPPQACMQLLQKGNWDRIWGEAFVQYLEQLHVANSSQFARLGSELARHNRQINWHNQDVKEALIGEKADTPVSTALSSTAVPVGRSQRNSLPIGLAQDDDATPKS